MSDKGSVGIVQTQYFTFAEPPHEMELDCGRKLGPITLAYETYGALNADKSNAVLITHALSGDAHAAGYHSPDDRKPGWWDNMIGPGKGFDTSKYFVICSNVLGGCMGSTGPSAINPATGEPYGLDFPIITIGDMVKAQRYLIDHLGIPKLLAVAGGSMGGMQALDWITRYPERVSAGLVIASTPLLSAQALAFDAVGRNAIQADPAFHEGKYYGKSVPSDGLGIARMLAHITYLSDASMRAKFGRALRNSCEYNWDFESEFSVETYLDYQGTQFVNRFDANSYLYITKAINYFDIAANFGSLDAAMARVNGKVLVLSYSSDWLYPPYQSEEIVYALLRQKKDVSYCNIESDAGHDGFLLEVDVMEKIISGFLEHVAHTAPDTADNAELEPPKQPPYATQSIYEGERVDYDMIVNLVDEGSRVLDLGCGDGELLSRLIRTRNVTGMGVEVDQTRIVNCMRRGISVLHANIDHGLNGFPDNSFDYVILSMTLQVVKKPDMVMKEMLRIGKKCIVSFPNFAYWKARLLTLGGKAPVTRNLPFEWYNSPNRHVLTIRDFREFCQKYGFRIEREIPLSSRGGYFANTWPNLFADEALYILSGI